MSHSCWHRGEHGGTATAASGYSILRQAQIASAVLDKLAINRVKVIGHSMGGEVTVALASLQPERIEGSIHGLIRIKLLEADGHENIHHHSVTFRLSPRIVFAETFYGNSTLQ